MIRQLHAADAPAYRAIRLAALRNEPQAFCATYQAESEKPELFMECCLKTGDAANILFGAFAGEELVGIAAFVKQQAEVIQVYTDKNHRGRGIGKQLLTALLNEAFGRFADLEAINIAVILTTNNALKLYQSLGFKSYRQQTAAVNEGCNTNDIIDLKLSRADWEAYSGYKPVARF